MGHMVYACLNKMYGYVVLQAYNSIFTDFGTLHSTENEFSGWISIHAIHH